jgi:pantothenate kinase
MGLAATTVASSFGKLVQPGQREAAMQAPQHLAKAVLLMVTNNIGSIAMLHARAAGVAHIMFTGSFLHDNKVRFESFVIHSFTPFNRIRYGFMELPMVSTV